MAERLEEWKKTSIMKVININNINNKNNKLKIINKKK